MGRMVIVRKCPRCHGLGWKITQSLRRIACRKCHGEGTEIKKVLIPSLKDALDVACQGSV